MNKQSSFEEVIDEALLLNQESRVALLARWKKIAEVQKDSIARFEKRGSVASAEHTRQMLAAYEEAIDRLEASL